MVSAMEADEAAPGLRAARLLDGEDMTDRWAADAMNREGWMDGSCEAVQLRCSASVLVAVAGAEQQQ